MTAYERYCNASLALDRSYSNSSYNLTENINIAAYVENEKRQRDKLLLKFGGKTVWRISKFKRISDGAELTEINTVFDDGSTGYWMPTALTADRAAEHYGADNQVND